MRNQSTVSYTFAFQIIDLDLLKIVGAELLKSKRVRHVLDSLRRGVKCVQKVRDLSPDDSKRWLMMSLLSSAKVSQSWQLWQRYTGETSTLVQDRILLYLLKINLFKTMSTYY